jgi:3-hydroxyisobutyrate dehydrogenase-like beta-hydroxyacid dehydrogenase
MKTMKEHVGFVGLGRMGSAMAKNLVESGFSVAVHNRTAERARPFAGMGASVAERPADAPASGGIAITMVSDDRALEDVVESAGFLEKLSGGGVHLSMSTVSPALSRRLARRHGESGSAYVAAPVFGRPDAAAARKLWICASGPSAARERVRPVLDALGQGVFEFGEDAGAANVVKLCGNFLIVAAMEAMGEAFALARKNGIEAAQVADLFGRTLFACPIYANYGAAIAAGRFTPAGFRLDLGAKDVRLVLQAGEESRVPMPIASLGRDRLLAAIARGRAEMDWGAMTLGIFEDAGLG